MIFSEDEQKQLLQIARGTVRFNEPMREHTTIKVGGPADAYFEPASVEDLSAVLKWLDSTGFPKMILGNGSNTLVRDGGIRGLVVSLGGLSKISGMPDDATLAAAQAGQEFEIEVESGVTLPNLLAAAHERSLTGLEQLAGIPASVGGAVVMNAGTNEGSISESISSVKLLRSSRIVTIDKADLGFGYRKMKLPKGAIVISATFKLKVSDKSEIEHKMDKIRKHRKETQPLSWPSLGSVFKNPEHKHKAWQLIDESNLRNVRVGGARISNEHANWIVNEGTATASDIEILIKMIRDQVKDRAHVTLDTEIVIVGEKE